MEYMTDEARRERLYLKALAIRYEHRAGRWMPIIRHLTLRGHPGAMRELADWLAGDTDTETLGTPSDAFSPAGLYRRAHRKGDTIAAANAAVSCFNRNDMAGYREWLRKAAKAGDADADEQLRYFEIRLPHRSAGKVRRLRPQQRRDGFA